jgi:hypothetical protein
MKMKVLFAFGGIPHYVHALLEKMQTEGIEVVVVTPRKGNAIIGKGVKMVNEGSYKHITTEEKKMYYGKVAYPELPSIIEAEKPNIFVVGWPYFLQLFFQSSLKRALKECHTKTLLREIPFQTPPYGKIRTYFEQHPMYDENMNLLSKGFPFLYPAMDHVIRSETLLCPLRRHAELLYSRLRHSPFLWGSSGEDTRHLQLYRYRRTSQSEE